MTTEREPGTNVSLGRPSPIAEAVAVTGAQLAVMGAVLSNGDPVGLAAAASVAAAAGIGWLVARATARRRPRRIARDGRELVLDDHERIAVDRIRGVDVRAVPLDREAPRAVEERVAGWAARKNEIRSDDRRGADVVRMRWIDADDRVLAEIEVGSREEADRLLAELGLDDARPAQDVALLPRAFSFSQATHRALSGLGAATLAVVVSAVSAALGWLSILSVPFVIVLAGAAITGRVRIGDDGIEIRPALGSARFVSFSEIHGVERDGGVVHVTLASGERIELAVAGARRGKWQSEHADALLDAVRRGLERSAPSVRGAVVAQLARGERDEVAWKDALRALAREGGYRGRSIGDEELLAIARDRDVEASAREGAALVLRERGIDPATLIELAARSANPRVRVALEAIAHEATALEADEDENERAAPERRRAR